MEIRGLETLPTVEKLADSLFPKRDIELPGGGRMVIVLDPLMPSDMIRLGHTWFRIAETKTPGESPGAEPSSEQ